VEFAIRFLEYVAGFSARQPHWGPGRNDTFTNNKIFLYGEPVENGKGRSGRDRHRGLAVHLAPRTAQETLRRSAHAAPLGRQQRYGRRA
jgi:hypothetical protein